MTVRLIVNSDDYGRSSEVSRGIRHAHTHGIVTSTTCMMNFPNVADDLAAALAETPDLGLGVHLVLTSGRPLLPAAEIPTVVYADGWFGRLDSFLGRLTAVDPQQAKAELRAQIEKFVRITGRKPTHLDSHHHSSYFTAGLFRCMLELAREYNCPIRRIIARTDADQPVGLPSALANSVRDFAPALLAEFAPRSPYVFYATFYDEWATKVHLLDLITHLPASATAEIMCHPGYVDADLIAGTVYARQRAVELAVLTDAEVVTAVHSRPITLIAYSAL